MTRTHILLLIGWLLLAACASPAPQPTPVAVQPTWSPAATIPFIAGTLFYLTPDGHSIQRLRSDGNGAQTVLAAERAIAAWQVDPTGHTLVYTLVYDRDIDGAQRAPTYTVNADGTVQQLPFDPFYRSAANITPLPFDGVADCHPDTFPPIAVKCQPEPRFVVFVATERPPFITLQWSNDFFLLGHAPRGEPPGISR